MKRKDFLQRVRNRRRDDQLELREPERRRATDWRTLRVDLPDSGERTQELPVGPVTLAPTGLRLDATRPCWVRGYRMWTAEDGQARAELQYKLLDEPAPAPPGSTALDSGESWRP